MGIAKGQTSFECIVKQLRNDLKDVTANYVLEKFDLEKCRNFDEQAKRNHFVKGKLSLCVNHLQSASIDHSNRHVDAFNAYNEILVFNLLFERCKIEPVARTNVPAPDYLMTTSKNGYTVNLELKTISLNDRDNNYKDYQRQYTESLISIEQQFKKGAAVGIGDEVRLSPFKKIDGGNIHLHRKGVIESIRNKTESLYDPRQLNYNNNGGILLLDTSLLGFPYFIQELLPYYFFPPEHDQISGALWNACFGRIGGKTFNHVDSYNPTDHERPSNIGEPLTKNGVLFDNESLQAVVYLIHIGNETKFLGLHRSEMKDEAVKEALVEICDYINDDLNSAQKEIGCAPFPEIFNNPKGPTTVFDS